MLRNDASTAENMLPFAAKEVRNVMANLDMNIGQLAFLCGVDRNTASKWVNGKGRVPLATLRWLQFLETSYVAVQHAKGKR